MNDRLKSQVEFILKTDSMKEIGRQTYLADGSRKENDAEHSFHLALMVSVLHEYCDEEVDRLRTMEMVLIHDVVEIEAGDTYAYDTAAHADKAEREKMAADHVFGLLPDDQAAYYRGLWEEFESGQTPEARFARTLDRLQPILLTDAADGKSWKEHGVKRSWIEKRNELTGETQPELGSLTRELIVKNTENGNLIDE